MINGQCAYDWSGWNVSAAGDVNGDGLADIIVGARYGEPPIGIDGGCSYVVFGRTNSGSIDLSSIAAGSGGFVINGQCVGDQSGWSVSSAGDINGDGLADLIVGAKYADTAMLSSIKEQTLAMEAGRDPLTKLFNRRFLRTILQREVSSFMKTGHRFSAILVDVDHFKKINDRYGHGAGDLVLSQIAEILIAVVRAGDFVFRYGGEEFLLILNHINEEQAIKVAEKVRKRVDEHKFAIDDNLVLHLTVSMGIAMHDGHPDYNRTLSAADSALYNAKAKGRNRCCFFGRD
ncbi:diguanylate cyclase [Gammaproteobacteria bacterium]